MIIAMTQRCALGLLLSTALCVMVFLWLAVAAADLFLQLLLR